MIRFLTVSYHNLKTVITPFIERFHRCQISTLMWERPLYLSTTRLETFKDVASNRRFLIASYKKYCRKWGRNTLWKRTIPKYNTTNMKIAAFHLRQVETRHLKLSPVRWKEILRKDRRESSFKVLIPIRDRHSCTPSLNTIIRQNSQINLRLLLRSLSPQKHWKISSHTDQKITEVQWGHPLTAAKVHLQAGDSSRS